MLGSIGLAGLLALGSTLLSLFSVLLWAGELDYALRWGTVPPALVIVTAVRGLAWALGTSVCGVIGVAAVVRILLSEPRAQCYLGAAALEWVCLYGLLIVPIMWDRPGVDPQAFIVGVLIALVPSALLILSGLGAATAAFIDPDEPPGGA
jgi:hypothetical protein